MGNCSSRDIDVVENRRLPNESGRSNVNSIPQRPKTRSSLTESFQRPKSKSFLERSSSFRMKPHRFSLSFMSRQESDIPIAEESNSTIPTSADRKGAPRTPETEYYRSDTDDEGISIDIDLILGNEVDSPGVIHARWGEPAIDPDEEEICTDFKGNPFKVGFCINCQKQHDLTETGEVNEIKEYKRISTFTVWQLQMPANPNISTAPEAMVGVGRKNVSYSQRNLRLSTLSDRESDIDLAEILRQRRDLLLQLEESKPKSVPKVYFKMVHRLDTSRVVYASQGGSLSLQSLEMVAIRSIIEREACLEAMQQLSLTFSDITSKTRPWKLVRNLTRQYRIASVNVIDAILQWKAEIAHGPRIFLWKQSNYLLKMCSDITPLLEVPDMLKELNFMLEENPLLIPIRLNDAVFDRDGIEVIDMIQKVCPEEILQDISAEKLAQAIKTLNSEYRQSSSCRQVVSLQSEDDDVQDKMDTMHSHVDHARKMILNLEMKRKEIGEDIHSLTSKLENTITLSKAKVIQTKINTRKNELKNLMGELFKRRNELTRQESILRMKDRHVRRDSPSTIENELHQVIEADSIARERRLASLESQNGTPNLESMSQLDVFEMVKSLGLHEAAEKLRSMGIDGSLLAVSTDSDLQEVGISVRLHRVKILRHIQHLVTE